MPPRKAPSRLLVIDADVLRASGGEDATHATAQACRDFLRDVLVVCHRAYLPDLLADEWREHASVFGATWKAAKARRGKLERIHDQMDPEVRRPARKAMLGADQRVAFEKDLHLLEAALRAEHIVVTCDQRLIAIVADVKKVAKKLRSIRFVDPKAQGVDKL